MSCSIEPTHTITFAIPYYRGLGYLRRAIESVFAQNTSNWRLLVIDDGSDEPAGEVVAGFNDSRIAYLRNERTMGMAGNWNRCLDLCGTELVTLLHADDELLPNYAKLMIETAADEPAAVAVFCRAVVIDGEGRRVFSFPDRVKDVLAGWSSRRINLDGADGIARLLRGCFVMCPTMCYRKRLLRERRFSERWKMVLDLEFFSRLLADGACIVGVPVHAYAYRRHAHNATATYNESLLRFREEAALYDEIASNANMRDWKEVVRTGRTKRIVKLHLLFQIVMALARGRVRAAREQIELLQAMWFSNTRRSSSCMSR